MIETVIPKLSGAFYAHWKGTNSDYILRKPQIRN